MGADMSRSATKLKVAVVVIVVLVVLAVCTGTIIPGTDIVAILVFGWIPFLRRVIPQLHVRWDMVISAAVYTLVLATGGHFFLRWLYREIRGSNQSDDALSKWKWRWTLGGLLLILLMFAAGIATVGIAHQTTWLVRSPESLYRPEIVHRRNFCAVNLRRIGMALQMYVLFHSGRYPDDLSALYLSVADDLGPGEMFVCPSSSDTLPAGDTPEARAQSLKEPGHCSYIYFGHGLVEPVDPNRIMATEPLTNHEQDGINVLFGDGHVEFYERRKAKRLLTDLGLLSPQTQPTTR